MGKIYRFGLLAIILMFCSIFIPWIANASPNSAYVILQAEHGDLVGKSLVKDKQGEQGFVLLNEGNQRDLLSMFMDLSIKRPYELWLNVKGAGSGSITVYSKSGTQVFKETIKVNSNNWKWIKLEKKHVLSAERYYLAISEVTGTISIDQILVRESFGATVQSNNNLASNQLVSTQSTSGGTAPLLPTQSPWVKQGLNPFSALQQNGSEFVSTTAAILTISATDLVVPGRGGLDLVFSRTKNSISYTDEKFSRKYPILDYFEFAFPSITNYSVSFPNGSECDTNDDDVLKTMEELSNGDKVETRVNSINKFFELKIYHKYSHTDLFFIKQYDIDHYQLYLADGSYYHFDKTGKIKFMQGPNPNNKIEFTYNSDGELYKIKDTLNHIYRFDKNYNKLEIVREEDAKVMLTYNSSGSIFTVKDALDRETKYNGTSEITYPSGKTSKYVRDSKVVINDGYYDEYGQYTDCSTSIYWIKSQEIYVEGQQLPVKKTTFTPVFSDEKERKVRYIKTEEYDENGTLILRNYYHPDTYGMLVRSKTIDALANKVLRTTYYTYNHNKERVKEEVYDGNIYDSNYDSTAYISDSLVNSQLRTLTNKAQWLVSEEEWQYDRWGNLVYHKDSEGYETMTSYVNSNLDRVFYRVNVGNGTSTAFYDNSAMASTAINNLPAGQLKIRKYLSADKSTFEGQETYYLYDEKGQLIESKSLVMNNGVKTWIKNTYPEYDTYGNNLKQILDADSSDPIAIQYKYDTDHSAYLTEKTQYIGRNLVDDTGTALIGKYVTTRYEYDYITGNQTKIIDPRGRELVYVYDDLNRATKVIYPKLSTEAEPPYEEVIYDDTNKKVKVYDAERKHLKIHYFDGLGRTTKIETYNSDTETDTDGNSNLYSVIDTTYNWQDKPKTVTDENSKITTYEYDSQGRQTKVVTDDGNITTTVYDDFARTSTTTDPNNVTHITTADRKGQTIKEAHATNNWIYQYEYDGYGNVIKTIDAKNQQMAYIYNNHGELIETRYPDHLGQVYDIHARTLTDFNYYDSKGQLLQNVNRKGEAIYYQYNEYGQVINVNFPNSPDTTYYYNELGQLIKVTQPQRFTKVFGYNERGLLTKETLTVVDPATSVSKVYTTEYRYNKNNQLTDIIYPTASGTLKHTYNNLNQVSTVQWQNATTLSNIATNIAYTKTGRLAQLTYGNGVIGTFSHIYKNGAYLTNNIAYSQGSKQLGIYDYRYDKLGNVIRANQHQYTYDAMNQLTGWKYLQENDKVLLGEKVIWDKPMTSQQGLSLNQIAVSNDRLELAIEPMQDIVKLARLVDASEVSTISNLEKQNQLGYSLTRSRQNYNESFTDASKLDATNTAYINTTSGTVTLPQNSTTSTARWLSVMDHQFSPHFTLQKNQTYAVSTSLGSFTPNQSYSGFQFENSREWVPYNDDAAKWFNITQTLAVSSASMTDVTKLNVAVKQGLRNKWSIWGGWGNWRNWVQVRINGVYAGMVYFDSPAADYLEETKTLAVNLGSLGVSTASGITISLKYTTNKWGTGETLGGTIMSVAATATEKKCYTVGEVLSYDCKPAAGTNLYPGVNYKIKVDATVPTGTQVVYELWRGTSFQKTITPETPFTVAAQDTTYAIRVKINTTVNTATPTVRRVTLYREQVYVSEAILKLNPVLIGQSSKSIALDLTQTTPAGTSVVYSVRNENSTVGVVAQYDDNIGKYIANLPAAGSQVIIQATLRSNTLQSSTPTISNIKVTAWDTGTYSSTGYLVTPAINVTTPSTSLILELHGLENGGQIAPSIVVNGISITGVRTTSEEIIMSNDTGAGTEGDTGSTEGDGSLNLTTVDKLRLEAAGKNLQTYYYRFTIPANSTTAAFTAPLTVRLYPNSTALDTPVVYSYIFFYNKLNYYATGNFTSSTGAIPPQSFTFDQLKLAVTGQNIPTGTTLTYQGYLPNSLTPIALNAGVNNLTQDVSNITFKGNLTSLTKLITPSLTRVTLTAVGETPFKNDLEVLTDVSVSVSGTLVADQERIVGNYSLKIDHTSVGSAVYTINGSHTFDATKLPVVQIWVKPLTSHSISFSSYDQSELRDERINSDLDRDGYYEVGEDLVLDKWNLVLLDLRSTQYSGIKKDAKGLKITVHNQGTKVMVDGVNSLPLNEVGYVYDKAGNRTDYDENGTLTRYVYTMGSNRLERWDRGSDYVVYTYDLNNNLVRQDVTVNGTYYYFDYIYNELNQLTEVKRNNVTIAKYYYDEAGLRYMKKDLSSGKTTIYVYGVGTEPIYEEIYNSTTVTGTPTKTSYLNLGSKRLARVESGGTSYYFTDHLGSTKFVMNPAGVCSYNEYEPFGEDFGATNSERYKFTGKEDDGATGLTYFNARYYDPAVGRFTTEDPAKDGWNWYQYVRNNPLGYTDPTGLELDFTPLDNTGCDKQGVGGAGLSSGSSRGGAYVRGATEVIMPNKPHTNKTPGHWFASMRQAVKMIKSGEYSKITLNQGLSKSVGEKVKPNNRPDVVGTRHDGKIDQFEVLSKTDDVELLTYRMKFNATLLGERAGATEIIYITR